MKLLARTQLSRDMPSEKEDEEVVLDKKDALLPCVQWANNLIGTVVAILCGIIFASYMQQLHETTLWFTNIKPVEQEISLRTEAGLYYSYYKSAVREGVTLSETIHELMHDTSTEYPREINVLKRFNIYQELILATIYNNLKRIPIFVEYLPTPMIFYVYSCFALTGFGVTTLFLLVWASHRSWIYGVLAFAWMCANLDDSTRAFFTVNLRENFALPFFWLQNFFAVRILQRTTTIPAKHLLAFTISTFLFALFWQFNQFILLLQSSALFLVALVIPSLSKTIVLLICARFVAYTFAFIAQFGQSMVFLSVCTSFEAAALVVLLVAPRFCSAITRSTNPIISAFMKSIAVVALCAMINITKKMATASEWDTHIWTFVKAKLGIYTEFPVPFETALYLCHGAFKFIDWGFFQRTSSSGCLVLYVISLLLITVCIVYALVKQVYKDGFEGL
ncbi:unnamed protein product [Toxocara canis]|uniref:C-mannosyltransferase DPY19L3 n=1 Tax=Toxocara canis TaxID=6265 RepID=A0A183TVR4_TOXCA|nr:unnamed protein product [Toxocara canis]